jgi:hypothetical protein
MATKHRPSFDPKSFLAMVGEGRSIGGCRKDQIVMSQGDPADAVFYIQRQGEGHRRFGARQGSSRRNAWNERFFR